MLVYTCRLKELDQELWVSDMDADTGARRLVIMVMNHDGSRWSGTQLRMDEDGVEIEARCSAEDRATVYDYLTGGDDEDC
jgi:hypothetical protein